MIKPLLRLGAGFLAAAVLFACGSDDNPLAQTEKNLADVDAANIDLRLASTSGSGDSETGPVGFRLRGPFAFNPDHDLAVFDLTYEQLLGGDTQTTKVRSTGDAAFVTVGGATYRVPEKDTAALKVSDDDNEGLSDFGIAHWVSNAKTTESDDTDVITGDVRVGDMLSDLARVAGSIGNDSELAALDGDAADRLQKLVRSSDIRVVTSKGHVLRSLHAVVNFGTKAPEELRRTLGKYAEAKIEVTLSMKNSSRTLKVAAPKDYREL